MPSDLICERSQAELSVAHDEGRPIAEAIAGHVEQCDDCQRFEAALADLDRRLARNATHLSPPYRYRPPVRKREWVPVAAALLAGLVAGALMAGFGRVATVQAHELRGLYDMASTSLRGLSASLRIVERGWHPDVPERVYTGRLGYSAPESLVIELADQTAYPSPDWQPNDLRLGFVDGDLAVHSSLACPINALPACQPPPLTRRVADLKPFDEALLIPLEIVGPSRSLTWWAGISVLGESEIKGRSAIQVETTVSGSDMLTAITGQGAWRELHPTDTVLIWLDRQSLAPLRIEVFAARSAERELWAGRHGYRDQGDQPLFIVELDDLDLGGNKVIAELPNDVTNGGFVEAPSAIPTPVLPPGFADHRQGQWLLPDGGEVSVRSWSDGRAWLMIETTEDWQDPHLFGLPSPFVEPTALPGGGIAYVSADQNRVSLHSESIDVAVSGSVPAEVLIGAAGSLGLRGEAVPADWEESAVVTEDQIPAGALVPHVPGWSLAGQVEGERLTVLLVGSGNQNVLIESEPGDRLDPPTGPDFSAVEVRATTGRFDAGTGTLEWVEDGKVLRMRSSTVALGTLLDLAGSMTPR